MKAGRLVLGPGEEELRQAEEGEDLAAEQLRSEFFGVRPSLKCPFLATQGP